MTRQQSPRVSPATATTLVFAAMILLTALIGVMFHVMDVSQSVTAGVSVTPENGTMRVQVVDLGSADRVVVTHPSIERRTLTETGAVVEVPRESGNLRVVAYRGEASQVLQQRDLGPETTTGSASTSQG